VDGSDNFATRYLVNDAAVFAGKPLVWGSVYQFSGQATVFWSQHGPCYRCLYPQPPDAGSLPPCAQSGVFGAVCASVAAIQATETIKLITGTGESLLGSLLTYDALTGTQRKLSLVKDPDCPICGTNPTITELREQIIQCAVPAPEPAAIGVEQLRDWLAAGRPMFLVDVREDWEWEIARIPGATLIPLGEITSGAALDRLPRDLPIVVHCKSGVRSAKALAVLHQAGLRDAVHVAGGILAWADRIDPTMDQY
jgi:sulfur-carrier protein adenylyltransferase/sulfurtransferase